MFHDPGPTSSRRPETTPEGLPEESVLKIVLASLEAAHCGTAVIDGQHVLSCNGALIELCNARPREATQLIERVEPEARAELRAAIARERRGRPERLETVWTRPDGSRLTVDVLVIGVELEGRMVCSLLVRPQPRFTSGVRQRIFGPSAAPRNVQHDLVVSASHALRTPLTALVLHLQCMQRALERPELDKNAVIRRVEKALQHTQQLTAQVNQLLDASTAAQAEDE